MKRAEDVSAPNGRLLRPRKVWLIKEKNLLVNFLFFLASDIMRICESSAANNLYNFSVARYLLLLWLQRKLFILLLKLLCKAVVEVELV